MTVRSIRDFFVPGLMTLIFLAGCATNRDLTADGAPLARQVTAAGHCGLTAPSLVYLASRQELDDFTRLQGQTLAAGGLEDHDFGREHLLVVALGQKPTGGYGVVLRSSEIRSDVLQITAEARAPAPGDMVTQALTTPCAVLAVSPRDWTSVEVSGPNLPGMVYRR
ncbi:protease complex subunit PrcB family protein [uncultured Marinobacter sp.]|uniref:protease complex subunit PrcB family protein n=1 Tax=uncultured Marinobacter sp. TaxID=187379 RepID=UPI0030DC9E4C